MVLVVTGMSERYRRIVATRYHPPTRFLIPGFSQTAGAWQAAISGLDGVVPLEIPAAEDFAATARALAATRTGVWGGYSLGGRLALQIAVAHPEHVTGLLLVSTTPGIADPAERETRNRADLELADWIEAHTIDEFLDRWLSQPLLAGRTRHHRRRDPRSIADQLRKLGQGLQPPLWAQLGSLQMPVTVAAGASDAKYSAIATEMVAAIGDNARLVIVPDAGHPLLEDAPGAIRSLLAEI